MADLLFGSSSNSMMRHQHANRDTSLLSLGLIVLIASASVVSQSIKPLLFGIPGLPSLALRFDFGGVEPLNSRPDLAIAVGHTSIVLVRNTIIQIRDKSGSTIASMDLSTFFNPVRQANGSVGDPYVLYDQSADRFFVVTESRSDGVAYYLLAVSKTQSPQDLRAGTWYFYRLNRSLDNDVVTNNWGDFDHLSVTENALVITASMYSFQNGSSQGVKVRILDKSKLIRGEAITTWSDLRDDAFGRRLGRLLPSTMDVPLPDALFLVSSVAPCGFQIWRMTNLLSTPSLTTATVSDSSTGCLNQIDAAQPGDGPAIDLAGVGFNSQPVYRNGSLWVASNVAKNLGGKTIDGIFVAEIDVSRWPDSVRLAQRTLIAQDDVWQYDPAIVVDGSNNVAIVYARSGTTEFASAYYTGRLATDPPGTFRTGHALRSGESVVNQIQNDRNRFLDYNGGALDPTDGSVWLFGMYAKTPDKSGSWVGNIDLRQQAIVEARERP